MANIELVVLLSGFFIIQVLTRTKITIIEEDKRPQNTRRLSHKSNSELKQLKQLNHGENKRTSRTGNRRINTPVQQS